MPNNEWFRCDKCGEAVKVRVQDWVKQLDRKCDCGGTFVKTPE